MPVSLFLRLNSNNLPPSVPLVTVFAGHSVFTVGGRAFIADERPSVVGECPFIDDEYSLRTEGRAKARTGERKCHGGTHEKNGARYTKTRIVALLYIRYMKFFAMKTTDRTNIND